MNRCEIVSICVQLIEIQFMSWQFNFYPLRIYVNKSQLSFADIKSQSDTICIIISCHLFGVNGIVFAFCSNMNDGGMTICRKEFFVILKFSFEWIQLPLQWGPAKVKKMCNLNEWFCFRFEWNNE